MNSVIMSFLGLICIQGLSLTFIIVLLPGTTHALKAEKLAIFGVEPKPTLVEAKEENRVEATKPSESLIFDSRDLNDGFTCEFYNPGDCNPATDLCKWNEKCAPRGPGRPMSCYAVWLNTSKEGFKTKLKGCYGNEELDQCHESDRCVAKSVEFDEKTYFCCCTTKGCNENLFYEPQPEKAAGRGKNGTNGIGGAASNLGNGNDVFNNIMIALVPVFVAAIVIILAYYCFRKYQEKQFYQKNGNNLALASGGCLLDGFSNGSVLPNGNYNFTPLAAKAQLIEVIARGRFGVIWKGQLLEGKNGETRRDVAVKIFPEEDVESWIQEQEIYSVPALKQHPNILLFIGAEYRPGVPPPLNAESMNGHLPNDPSNGRKEFWIITQLHPLGSLHDYLRNHTLSVPEVLRIGVSMLRGLAFLHEEFSQGNAVYGPKPTIVHRDFKSRNVLLKRDMSACIADFGLALKCEHGQTPAETHGQVGTRRYMAPEILEGATEFSAFAFRQIDVYAAGLVLWELLSRCRLEEVPIADYKLPFEAEVGSQPSLADMQECVLTQKRRPYIMSEWTQEPALAAICLTVEEMWESEPEARLTAGCAMERLESLCTSYPYQPHVHGPNHSISHAPAGIYHPPSGGGRSHNILSVSPTQQYHSSSHCHSNGYLASSNGNCCSGDCPAPAGLQHTCAHSTHGMRNESLVTSSSAASCDNHMASRENHVTTESSAATALLEQEPLLLPGKAANGPVATVHDVLAQPQQGAKEGLPNNFGVQNGRAVGAVWTADRPSPAVA